MSPNGNKLSISMKKSSSSLGLSTAHPSSIGSEYIWKIGRSRNCNHFDTLAYLSSSLLSHHRTIGTPIRLNMKFSASVAFLFLVTTTPSLTNIVKYDTSDGNCSLKCNPSGVCEASESNYGGTRTLVCSTTATSNSCFTDGYFDFRGASNYFALCASSV